MTQPDESMAQQRIEALERELREAREREHRLRVVFDHAFQFIGLLSPEGVLLEANRSSLEFVGASPADVVGRPFADTPWWTHAPELQARLREAIDEASKGRFCRFEATHVAADGAIHTVDFSIKPVFEAGTIGSLVVEGRDITDRKAAEEALRNSRAMMALVLDSIPVRVFWKDRESRYVGCNLQFAKDAGFPSTEAIIGKNDFDMGWRPQAELYRADDQRVMASGESKWAYEEPQTGPDGTEMWLSTSKLPLRDSKGNIVGVLGVYEDITERKRAEKRRFDLEARMQHAQKLESLGVLAGGIAHDFNNLLMAIVGNVEVLRVCELGEATSALGDIEMAALRAGDLCRQLLAYAGRGHYVIEPLSLTALAREMGELLRVSISKKARLTLALDDRLPSIDGDATQIRQVLMNLITNASDALKDGEGEIRLRTYAVTFPDPTPEEVKAVPGLSPGPYVVAEVEDTGCGMDEATRERIFEPFFTTKFTGRGLGLAAVQGIVKGHGGSLHVESVPSKGTRFRVYFPVVGKASAPAADAKAEPPFRGRGKVLLVDDEPAILAVGVKLLTRLGFEVETAADGLAAIARYAVGAFRCVIVDVTMPRFDGVETMRALRARDPDVKVVLTSGYTAHDVFSGMEAGRPDAFLGKPFGLNALVATLRGLLE
jgi:two-component system cell cycle sensor histidine kinase/response regulator CckA